MAVTLVPTCSVPRRSRASRRRGSSASTRTPRFLPAASWSHHPHGSHLLPNRRRGARKHHLEAPPTTIQRGSRRSLGSLQKVRTLPPSCCFRPSSTVSRHLHGCGFLPTESRFQSVKQALHTAVPERLLSRDDERASIRSFLEEKVLRRLPGSLYISGAPGTGKTACLNCVLQEMKVLRCNRSGKRKTQRFLTVQ